MAGNSLATLAHGDSDGEKGCEESSVDEGQVRPDGIERLQQQRPQQPLTLLAILHHLPGLGVLHRSRA
jgi:hypothetical protein